IREVHDGINSVLEFETFIDDISVNGVDMIKWNNEGKIVDFKVMIRPLKAVQKVQEKMIESLNSFK
ncbi:nuclear transport factor 2 family protein, partial [Gammaproteobacteria bacterium]|nr:nuclear transport factor 2 family protein [Gammaproteobacteria bacterium]